MISDRISDITLYNSDLHHTHHTYITPIALTSHPLRLSPLFWAYFLLGTPSLKHQISIALTLHLHHTNIALIPTTPTLTPTTPTPTKIPYRIVCFSQFFLPDLVISSDPISHGCKLGINEINISGNTAVPTSELSNMYDNAESSKPNPCCYKRNDEFDRLISYILIW